MIFPHRLTDLLFALDLIAHQFIQFIKTPLQNLQKKGTIYGITDGETLNDSLVFLFDFFLLLSPTDGTPLQYSCLENPMDRGAW